MKKWEYKTLVAGYIEKNIDKIIVFVIDDDIEAPVVGKTEGGFFALTKYIRLTSYLKQAGEEGWEVISSSPIEDNGERWGSTKFIVIMKREKE